MNEDARSCTGLSDGAADRTLPINPTQKAPSAAVTALARRRSGGQGKALGNTAGIRARWHQCLLTGAAEIGAIGSLRHEFGSSSTGHLTEAGGLSAFQAN